MSATPKQTFDVYRKRTNPTLRLAVAPGADLPGQFLEGLDIGAGALCAPLRRLGGRRHQRLLLLPAGQGLTAR